jgi:hypothetical protein
MTRKIRFLTAATAVVALPALAGAQVVGGAVDADVGAQVPVQDTLGTATRTVDEAQDRALDTVDEALDAADQSVEADAEVGARVGVGQVTAATAADLQAGASVRDTNGEAVGTIESVDADGAVLSTGEVRVKLPVAAFGRDENGLVIAMTRAELEAAAAAHSPS